MDTLRGIFGTGQELDEDLNLDSIEEEIGHEPPPAAIGNDERRMQVRAYNHWASQLGDRSFPSIEELEPHELPDFGPHSVLLDFSLGVEDPVIQFLGDKLAIECGAEGDIATLTDIPSRSLLSRITDHYMQILANQAPIGFEAEYVNQREATILYRGILLPYSSDGETIDFVLGVINWKEMADQSTTDELLLEFEQAMKSQKPSRRAIHNPDNAWADGPGSPTDIELPQIAGSADDASPVKASIFPNPEFGETDEDERVSEAVDHEAISRLSAMISPRNRGRLVEGVDEDVDAGSDHSVDADSDQSVDEGAHQNVDTGSDQSVDEGVHQNVDAGSDQSGDRAGAEKKHGEDQKVARASNVLSRAQSQSRTEKAPSSSQPSVLIECLDEARALAKEASLADGRSRKALYEAVSRAYDLSLRAQDKTQEFDAIIADAGLLRQERAPMTPVVKLVFGADYDKTRLTEYASVLAHAHRENIDDGALAQFLSDYKGGLKAVVSAERALRRKGSSAKSAPSGKPRESLAKKLRILESQPVSAISSKGEEFGLVMVRRLTTGEVVMLGEVSEDKALIEKAARKILR